MTVRLLHAAPVLRVSDYKAAFEFYCNKLGFEQQWVYQANSDANPSYAGLARDQIEFEVSSFPGDGVFGTVVHFYVQDVDALYTEFLAKGVKIDLTPTDQTWGSREMYLRDMDGNSIRFSQNLTSVQEAR
jgi:uncharacterized glyoxalase superfamily protein PhnB